MVFMKKAEVKDAEFKYGFAQQGVFATEPIKRGEAIFQCDLSVCDYLKIEESQSGKTRDETMKLFEEHPEWKDFVHKFIYMVDDDMFDWPRTYNTTQQVAEPCMFFNHSCDPNCGFAALDSSLVVAIRDIEVGEELTYDYQCMDTEATFYDGLECCCGSKKCRGKLRFDQYRNVDWQTRFYKYSGAYVKRKIDELKTKWYSANCFVKRCTKSSDAFFLASLRDIAKDELVAVYSGDKVDEPEHFVRHSETPNCILVGNEVFAAGHIEPNTPLTVNFNN
jgi:SET domain-containing protein